MDKPTLVLGASLKPDRFSYRCVKTLVSANVPVYAIGLREGSIDRTPVYTGFRELHNIHTVTLYLGSENQIPWNDYIRKLKPVRVIFNPGTENPEFEETLKAEGVETIEDCTIMMVQGDRF
ncbi:MAG: CoA-binding protein [Bacteroidales bacterium]